MSNFSRTLLRAGGNPFLTLLLRILEIDSRLRGNDIVQFFRTLLRVGGNLFSPLLLLQIRNGFPPTRE